MNYCVRILLLSVLLFSGAAAAAAQSFEIPNVEYANDKCELGAESRVFVHAPLSARLKIVKILREHSDLQISERPEDADFILLYTYTPFADSSLDGGPVDMGGAVTARAELAAVKFVRRSEDQVRPRILFYWTTQKSYHNIPIPMKGLSSNGFAAPHSGKSAAAELIARLALWTFHKKWRGVSFNQFSNELSISTGGKFEDSGAKAFLKELKNARREDYRRMCASRSSPPPAEVVAAGRPAPPAAFPNPPTATELPPAELLPRYQAVRSRLSVGVKQLRPVSRSKKARLAKRPKKRGRRR